MERAYYHDSFTGAVEEAPVDVQVAVLEPPRRSQGNVPRRARAVAKKEDGHVPTHAALLHGLPVRQVRPHAQLQEHDPRGRAGRDLLGSQEQTGRHISRQDEAQARLREAQENCITFLFRLSQ